MLQTFKLTSQIEKTVTINKFIFKLKKSFLFKNISKNLEYGNYGAKNRLWLAAFIWDFIKRFLVMVMIACVSIGYPLLLAVNSKNLDISKYEFFIHLFICFYVFWGCLANVTLFRTDKNKFIYIKLMHMDAKKYVFSQFIIRRLFDLICEILIFDSFSYLLSGLILPILSLIFAKFIFRCFGEMLHLLLYKKTGKIFERSLIEYLGLLAFTALIAYSPLVLNKVPTYSNAIVFVLALSILALGVIGLLYMINFKGYYEIIIDVTKVKNIRISSQDLERARTANIRLKDADNPSIEIKKSKNKYGFEYFNIIFFERFKTAFIKPLKIRAFGTVILFVSCLSTGLLYPQFRNIYSLFILKYTYIIIYALFIIFNQDKFTKMMFYNCDLPLLKYGLYSNNEAVYSGFKQRLKKLLFLNLVPAVLIFISFLILEFVFFHKLSTDILLLAVFIVLSSAFLTVNNLSLYYLMQPYSSSIEVKNHLYHYIPNLFMVLSVMLLSTKWLSLQMFLLMFSIFQVVCLPFWLILVKKFSFKTFKIRN